MKRNFLLPLFCLCLLLFPCHVNAAEHRLGGGINYWYSIDELKGDDFKFDDTGFGIIGSYQYWGGLIGIEADIELLPDRFGENALSPQAYFLVGGGLYAGIGVGTTYIDGNFSNEPFYALRAGYCMELLPNIYADIYTTYRFNDNAKLDDIKDDIDTDSLFLGATVRFTM